VAAALEDALREREVTHGHEPLTLRSDDRLVFGAKIFVSVVRRASSPARAKCQRRREAYPARRGTLRPPDAVKRCGRAPMTRLKGVAVHTRMR